MSENMNTNQEVTDETNDGKLDKLLSYDFKIKEASAESIKYVTDIAKKTGDYSNLSPTDIKVLALAYQIDKEMEREDDFMMEPTMQRTVAESPNHTSNPENKNAEIIDANENEEFTKDKETDPPKQPASDSSKINIPGPEGAEQGADWSAIKIEGSDAVHLGNLIGDNFEDQKLADIVALIKKMDLTDESSDEDSDSDFLDSEDDTDGEDPYSSEKLGEKKEDIRVVEFEDEAIEKGT